jgi:hypothetical protein
MFGRHSRPWPQWFQFEARHQRARGAAQVVEIEVAVCVYRVDQSYPLRVSSRTPAPSRRTIMRKPSCLIS